MTYADNYSIRTTSVKFNDVADALDGLITRNYAGLTTGTSTTYIATPSPAWDAYTTSGLVVIIPHVANTGAATINISGLGARDLRIGNAAIAAGVLQQNIPTIMAYTGTYFEVLLQQTTIPIASIYPYAGGSAPTGYLLCDGSSQSTTGAYAALHGVIGYTYGGSGGTFNVPDLRRRIPTGKGASDTLGANEGQLYTTRSFSHSHTIPAHYHEMGAGATLNITASGSGTSGTQSADHTHSGTTGTQNQDHSHSGTTTVGGRHTHSTAETATADSGSGDIDNIRLTGGTGAARVVSIGNTTTDSSAHAHSFTTGGVSANHDHAFSTGGVSANHTHSIPTHTHAAGNFSGAIGLVTGGVHGNDNQASGPSTQPYLVLNYIIKT
jgi:microcystin-dependent protein